MTDYEDSLMRELSRAKRLVQSLVCFEGAQMWGSETAIQRP